MTRSILLNESWFQTNHISKECIKQTNNNSNKTHTIKKTSLLRMKSTRLHRNKTVVGISPALRSRTTRQDPTQKNCDHHARQPHQHPFQRIPTKLPNKWSSGTYVRKYANGVDLGEFHGDSCNSLQINDRGIHGVQRLLQVSHRDVQRNIHQLAELSSPA